MEICKHHLVFSDEGIFGGDWLLNFYNHVGLGIDILDGREYDRSGRCVFAVGESAAFAGGVLNIHGMAVFYKFLYSCRGCSYSVLIVLNLFGYSYYHNLVSLVLDCF